MIVSEFGLNISAHHVEYEAVPEYPHHQPPRGHGSAETAAVVSPPPRPAASHQPPVPPTDQDLQRGGGD